MGASTEEAYNSMMNYMQQVAPEQFKDQQAKYMPGIGVAKVPIAEKDREALTSYNVLQKAVQDAEHFQRTTAGALGTFPGSANDAVAESKRQAIVLELNKLHGLNRLNDTEYHAYMNSVGSPGSFRTQKSVDKFKELAGQINRSQQSMYSSLGMTPFGRPNMDQQAQQWAQANPKDPRAQAILQKLSGNPTSVARNQ